MKQRISMLLLSVLMLAGWLSSCSSTPEYGKMIPKDAIVVKCLEVDEAIESSNLGDLTPLVDKINKMIESSSLSADARIQLKQMVAEPDELGFDFTQPMYFFLAGSMESGGGLVGGVDSKDNLTKLMGSLHTMGVCGSVKTLDQISYVNMNEAVFAFTDEWFFVTLLNRNPENEREVVQKIAELASQKKESSLADSKVFAKMHDRDGFVHVLVLGSGYRSLMEKFDYEDQLQVVEKMLPGNVKISDFAAIYDGSIKKGEALLTFEALAQTPEAEKVLGSYDFYNKIDGTFEKYVPADALFYAFGNLDGKKYFAFVRDILDKTGLPVSDTEMMARIQNIVEAVDGDVTISVDTEEMSNSMPNIQVFVNSKDKKWLSMLSELDRNGQFEEEGTDQYKVPLKYDGPYAYFGQQGETAYLSVKQNGKPLQKVDNSVDVDGGLYGYARINFAPLLQKDVLSLMGLYGGSNQAKMVQNVLSLFDYVEVKMDSRTKAEIRVVMKDKDQTPVQALYNELLPLLKWI